MNPYRRFKFPWRSGNHFTTLVDSVTFFPRMLAAIEKAEHYILLEMYLVSSGQVADRFIAAIRAAAARGVQVYLLFDDFGAQDLSPADRERLQHTNIASEYYNPLHSHSTLSNLYRIYWQRATHGLHRNHRKLLLVDGTLAFAGGAGITDEVDSPDMPHLQWRETMIEIRGPVVDDWQRLFTESWNASARQPLDLPPLPASGATPGQRGRVTVNEARRRMGIQRSLLKRIQRAEHRIWFATAYFIPSWTLRRRLKHAAKRGVDVRLLLPGPVTDHPGARYASRRYYERLLNNGLRIYEYTPRFFHAKTVLCDDWVSIGSCNFDRWNLQWNLEANQEIDDSAMAEEIAELFRTDFSHSVEHLADEWARRGWYQRALEWLWQRVERLSLKIRHRK
ncbi:MAG TPA: phosphatidylserine/phosphatidylglycerophosphate/cardiolipin synthase family protein [Gammaproteobacteria bacterium]|nr:phosphatidylserine/phosphatidylglycerophosphate/cardiolipin synthase family protein [Gammaproteobacteria bacterium]